MPGDWMKRSGMALLGKTYELSTCCKVTPAEASTTLKDESIIIEGLRSQPTIEKAAKYLI